MIEISTRRNIKRIVLIVVLCALLADEVFRYFQDSVVELDRVATTGATAKQKRTLTVVFPGILSPDPQISLASVNDVMWENGDVLYIKASGDRYRRSQVVDTVVEYLVYNQSGYDKIAFIGISFGGGIAAEVWMQLEPRIRDKVRLAQIDAPMSASDVQFPLDVGAKFFVPLLRCGPIMSVPCRIGMKLLMRPPQDENIEPGANRANLNRGFREMSSQSPGYYMDQVRAIDSFGGLEAGSLKGLKQLVIVRSEADNDTVRDTAIRRWQRALGSKCKVLIVRRSKHAAFLERPKAWRATFRRIYEILLQD